jgi:hypothetical protein
LARLLGRERDDLYASLRQVADEPFGFQLTDRLAHEWATDAEHLAQFSLNEAVARAELTARNRPPQQVRSLLAERGGDPDHT